MPASPSQNNGKNKSGSHNPWSEPSNNPDPQDTLGSCLLFTFNPYPGFDNQGNPNREDVRKLGAGARGSSNDEHFWMDQIQTSYVAKAWEHKPGEAPVFVPKQVRIPYVVRDQDDQLVLDYLLVGYVKPVDPPSGWTPPAQNDPDWGNQNPRFDVGLLGRTIMVDLYPKQDVKQNVLIWGTSRPEHGWPTNPNAFFDGDPTLMPARDYSDVRKRIWEFRDLHYQIEKSLVMTHAARMSNNTWRLGKVIIGYEGGAGW